MMWTTEAPYPVLCNTHLVDLLSLFLFQLFNTKEDQLDCRLLLQLLSFVCMKHLITTLQFISEGGGGEI